MLHRPLGVSRKQLGNFYETVAAVDARKRGIQIVARNLYTRHGEIDILGREKDTLVVIEVRGRQSGDFPPHRYLSRGKLTRLNTLALWASHRYHLSARVELVEIIGPRPSRIFERIAVVVPSRYGLTLRRFPLRWEPHCRDRNPK